ncbi:DNA-binding phage protein [Bradyrhizobium sp. S3.12.5]|uniref:helix-turn-helix domain-containing protein n=1 Tax=Bradyrhizobium sp. S3.12.5 TaxID=3156386 RepID=UPI0033943D9B
MNNSPIDPKMIEAEENALIDWQFLLQEMMSEKGVTKSQLAELAGISKPRLTQILSSEANPTVKSMARLFHALGEQLCVSRKALAAQKPPTSAVNKPSQWQWGEGPRLEERKDEQQLVRIMKENFASNDNHAAKVMFIDSEVDLAPEPDMPQAEAA